MRISLIFVVLLSLPLIPIDSLSFQPLLYYSQTVFTPPPIPETSRRKSTSLFATNPNSIRRKKQNQSPYATLRSLGRSGKIKEVLSVYDDLVYQKRLDVRACNLAIDACGRCRPVRPELAVDIFERGFGSPLFSSSGSGLESNKFDEKCHGITTETEDEGNITPNVFTFSALLSVHSRQGDINNCLRILRLMETTYSTPPNLICYSTCCLAASIARKPEEALRLLDEAEEKKLISDATSITKSESESIIYNTVMSACVKCSRHADVESISARMMSRNIARTPFTYASLMASCEARSDWKGVEKVYNEMRGKKMVTDGVIVTSVLKARRSLGDVDGVLRAFEDFKNSVTNDSPSENTSGLDRIGARKRLLRPDAAMYNLVISSFALTKNWSQSLSFLSSMESSGVKPGVKTYSSVMSVLASCGMWNRGISLLKSMEDAGVRPNVVTYSALISACCIDMSKLPDGDRIGRLEVKRAVEKIWEEMKAKPVKPNLVAFNCYIKACGEGLDPESTMEAYSQLIYEGFKPNQRTFSSLMTGCQRMSDADCVGKIFRLMAECDPPVRPNKIIYGQGISTYTRSGRPKEAEVLLEHLLKSEEEGEVTQQMKINYYQMVVTAYERKKEYRRAIALLDNMRERGIEFYDVGVINSAFKRIIKLLGAVTKERSVDDFM